MTFSVCHEPAEGVLGHLHSFHCFCKSVDLLVCVCGGGGGGGGLGRGALYSREDLVNCIRLFYWLFSFFTKK